MKSSIKEFKEIDDETKIDDFVNKIFYTSINFDECCFLSKSKRKNSQAKDKH